MNRIEKIICMMSILCLMSTVSFTASAHDGERLITVYDDGVKIESDVNPVLENGRTLVPLRRCRLLWKK